MTLTTPARRRARLLTGVIAGAALALAAPLAASAHIHVTPEESDAGASTRLTFSFSHGCDGSPTTALVFDLPDGIDGVTPVLDGAWTIQRVTGDDGIPTQLTYTAVTPVEDGTSASVAIDVIFASSVSGSDVAFAVRQECVTGANDWSEVAAAGETEDDLESPAPVVAVGAVADGDAHAHADGDGDETEATHEAADVAGSDPVARWLAGGALAAALAALVVTLVRRRA